MPTVPRADGARQGLNVGPSVQLSTPQVATIDAKLSPALLDTPQLNIQQRQGVEGNPAAIRSTRLADPTASQRAVASNLGAIAQPLGQYALDTQIQVNATIVDDAVNRAREAAQRVSWGTVGADGTLKGGFKNAKGYDALNRASGKALPDEAADELDKAVQSISKDRLHNDAQRRAFNAQYLDMRTKLYDEATTHVATQFSDYQQAVNAGSIQTLQNDAALSYDDPMKLRDIVGNIDRYSATIGALTGAPATAIEAGQRKARSIAIIGAAKQALADKKYGYAQALLNEWKGKMDQDGIIQLKGEIDGHVAIVTGEQVAAGVFKGRAQPAFAPTDADRVARITAASESNNRDLNPDGSVRTSPKGAKGRMQVMDGTNLDPGFGVRPARDNSLEERARVGRDYINTMITRYGGDMRKAWAAYNWGPGNLDKAIKDHGPAWFDNAPKETKDYVSRNLTAYGAGEGVPPQPTRQELYDQVDAQLPGAENVEARKAAYSWLDKRFTAAEQDHKMAQENAYAEGIRVVRETGGNINAISPALRGQIDPKDFTQLQSYAKNMADGQYTVTDPAAYYLITDPNVARSMSAAQLESLRPKLSETDFKTAQKVWQDAHQPEPGKGPDSLDVAMVNGILENRLAYMGVETSGKKPEDKARIGAIRQFVHQYVLQQQGVSGQKVTDYKGMETLVNQLFTRNQTFRTSFFGLQGSKTINVMTAREGDIPDADRKAIDAKLKKALGRDPSEAETLQAYWRSQFYNNGGKASGR
ncbi:lysis protein [Caulobacter phage SR18]|nr:lysis protein [Caulobacter phage SR18]WCD56224.1 lysis protein [Caulobacter phage BL94]